MTVFQNRLGAELYERMKSHMEVFDKCALLKGLFGEGN